MLSECGARFQSGNTYGAVPYKVVRSARGSTGGFIIQLKEVQPMEVDFNIKEYIGVL